MDGKTDRKSYNSLQNCRSGTPVDKEDDALVTSGDLRSGSVSTRSPCEHSHALVLTNGFWWIFKDPLSQIVPWLEHITNSFVEPLAVYES